MLRTISPQDMQEMERAFLNGTGYPSILLMEHAAQAVVKELEKLVPPGSRVLFVCGGGNNGGDGCAAARLWMQQGGRAEVWLLKNPSQMKGDAGVNACLLNSYDVALNVLYGEAPEIPAGCAAVVDALFGTGLSRELEGAALSAVERINESGLPVAAVDIPSGVDGASGCVLGDAVRADVTITFHRAKHGHFLFPGRRLTGRLVVADIGILPDWDGAQGYDVLEAEDVRALLPARRMEAHKGSFGHVLVAAGSEGMAGAAALCTQAAVRAGAGLVTAAVPACVIGTVQMHAPCAMARRVTDGPHLDASVADALTGLCRGKRALAIGPGLSREAGVWEAIEQLVHCDMPKVIDADALSLLAEHGGGVGANTVLTPHPGEMARLCGMDTAQVLASPVEAAQQLAQDLGACVVLKGATTIICQQEDITFSTTGTNAMGTGGSGDVLTGIIAALLAQGMEPMDAARAGVFYHGLAGESAEKALGARAVSAEDLCHFLRIE